LELQETWLGIPPNGNPVCTRFDAHFVLDDNKITHAWIFIDMIDVLEQVGVDVFA
jgi:predicted ester cyclase